jgi:glycosyltransferase involved in cell wall biosynthesis
LLDAFAAALPTLNATLVLAGSGEIDRRYAAKVRARLRSLPQARCVGALGPAALARALSEADVFINASDYESWGMAAAEAQAAGLPVLSWSSGGLWEFLTPGEDSLRVRAPSLARLATPGLVARLERGARRAARRRRTWKAAARAFADFLSERLEVR